MSHYGIYLRLSSSERYSKTCQRASEALHLISLGSTYIGWDDSLVDKVLAQTLYNLNLLVRRKTVDRLLNDTTDAGLVHRNEARVVHEGEKTHDKLAIHAIRHATVSGNRVTEVLDLERTLQSGGKETAKWSNEGSKSREDKDVELHRCHSDSRGEVSPIWRDEGKTVVVRNEDGVDVALKAGEEVGTEVLS